MHCLRFAIALLSMVCSISLSTADPPTTQPATRPAPRLWHVEDRDYAVFSAVIVHWRQKFQQRKVGVPKHVLIADRTEDWRLFYDLDPNTPDDEEFTFDESPINVRARWGWKPDDLDAALKAACRQPGRLDARKFSLPGVEVVLYGQEDYRHPRPLQRRELWDKHPDGHSFLLFSRVGFSKTAERAVVHMHDRPFGTNAGAGTMYLLEKQQGVWRVVATRGTYIT